MAPPNWPDWKPVQRITAVKATPPADRAKSASLPARPVTGQWSARTDAAGALRSVPNEATSRRSTITPNSSFPDSRPTEGMRVPDPQVLAAIRLMLMVAGAEAARRRAGPVIPLSHEERVALATFRLLTA